jgi:beta-lactamase class A
MTYFLQRRALLRATAMLPIAMTVNAYAKATANSATADISLEKLEHHVGGRLGVFALNSATGQRVQYRANERFPFCSTFKAMLAAAVLSQSVEHPALLAQQIHYKKGDIDSAGYTPITQRHVETGMSVADLCAAAIQYSDNAAANLLIQLIGGPPAVTAYARSIGDTQFRLDRLEPALNEAVPGDLRDTTTPAAMAKSLRLLVLGEALPALQRTLFTNWLCGNTTGRERIRAGVPNEWQVGDKTGTGAYGTTNDIAVIWPLTGGPIVIAVYYTQTRPDAKVKEAVISAAARNTLARL